MFYFHWSENITLYIFISENIKYTLYFINLFLHFNYLYMINRCTRVCHIAHVNQLVKITQGLTKYEIISTFSKGDP